MTAGSDGVLVVWNIGFNDQGKLIHAVVKTIDLVPDQIGGGRPCSLSYMAPFGNNDSVVVGTTNNSILEVKADTSELSLLITAHTGVLEAVGVHASKPFYVTAGRDKTVRVWDASARAMTCRARIHAPATCVAWSPDGKVIVVGTVQGDFAVFGIGDDGGRAEGLQSIMIKQLLRNGTRIHSKKDQVPVGDPKYRTKRQTGQPSEMTPMQRKMRALRGVMADSPSKSKPFKRHEEVQDIKFSPNGKQLAIASRDNNVYIYNVVNGRNFEFNGACRGHSSYVTHLDWTEDSTTLQSTDGSYELLYWNAMDAKQVSRSLHAMNFVVVVVGKSKVSSSMSLTSKPPRIQTNTTDHIDVFDERCCVEHMDMHHGVACASHLE